LRDLYLSTLNHKHVAAKLQLKRVYSVEIGSMKRAFEERSRSMDNIMELWHGTNIGNILSISRTDFALTRHKPRR
jgi:hypothetical protein